MLKAFEQAYGKLDPKQCIGNLFFGFLGADKVVAPKLVGAYVGGFGNGPGLKTPEANAYRAIMKPSCTRSCPAGRRLRLQLLQRRLGARPGARRSPAGPVGAKLQAALPRAIDGPFQISNGGVVQLDSRRQAIQDQYQLQIVKNADGSVGPTVVGVRAERRPVVRRPLQADEPAARVARSLRARS